MKAFAPTVEEARDRLEKMLQIFHGLHAHVAKEIKAFDKDVRGDLEFIKMAVRDHVYACYPGVTTRKLSKEMKKIRVVDPIKMSICFSDLVEKLYKLGNQGRR